MPIPSLFTGAGALTTQQNAISIVANNIANVNTTGYKRSAVHFSQQINNLLKQASSPSATRGGTDPIEVGVGMKLSDVNTIFSQGAVKQTGLATDMAISGVGFFVVSGSMKSTDSTITSPEFSRDGHFKLDSDNNLITADGKKVVGATIYDNVSGKIKTIDAYSAVTYFTDQAIGTTIKPNDGVGTNPAVPTPTATNVTGIVPSFDASIISEISVRGGLLDSTQDVTVATKGDLTITRDADGKMVFTFDDANGGTAATQFIARIDSSQQFLDNVATFEMENDSGKKIQMRIRFEPGTTNIEDVFKNIEYDSTTATSDTLVFGGGVATTQASDSITVSNDDMNIMKLTDLKKLFSTIRIPSFFHTLDASLEKETSSFTVGADGSIAILGPSSERQQLGRVLVANFTNADGLLNNGGNTFSEGANSGLPAISVIDGPFDKNAPSITGTQVVSGALETSNVNIATEFAELIGLQRGLQLNATTVQRSDEILQTLIGLT